MYFSRPGCLSPCDFVRSAIETRTENDRGTDSYATELIQEKKEEI